MIVLWTKTPGLHKTQSSFILETKAMDRWPNKWKIFIIKFLVETPPAPAV